MKKFLMFLFVTLSLTSFAGMASALTYNFDPNDLVDLYDKGAPLGTLNPDSPRSLWTGGAGTLYPGYTGIGNWNAALVGGTMDTAISTDYLNWLNVEGGYITGFNIWLADNPRARGWGEALVIKPNTGLTATASTGWSVEVSTNAWHDDLYYAKWTADDMDHALKVGGMDIGDFSFSANLYVDANQNGWDASDARAVIGEDYSIWFGGYGVGNNDILPEDDAWGSILYQGTLDIAPVPEPTTMLLFGLGLLGFAGMSRKKGQK